MMIESEILSELLNMLITKKTQIKYNKENDEVKW